MKYDMRYFMATFLLFHSCFIPISLRYFCYFIAISFPFHCDIFAISFLFHFYFIAISFPSGSKIALPNMEMCAFPNVK